ncbi:glycosyltransferase family 4 protein [Spirillospora sp. NPDC048911]|uniref:glycosyltransferase family 4 protein n=1 Tax=Spirillospora sp. NPDC048911 TaxID=3364527 RepID=UPI00371BF923
MSTVWAFPSPSAATTPTVAVLMHDGFYSCGTGAGRSNRAFLQVLTELKAQPVRLAALPIHLSSTSGEYNATWHKEMQHLVHQAGGHVFPIDNGTAGQVRFGDLAAFQHACSSAAKIIREELLPTSKPLLVTAFDCPFYGLAAQLAPHIPSSTYVELVIVARSTAVLHAPGDTARMEWERSGLQQAVTAGGRVAAISAHMRDHLTEAYQLPHTRLLKLPNGLTSQDWRHIAPPDMRLLPPQAQSGFLLAMGRAVEYKGFDDLLDALVLLKDRRVPVPHTLLAAVTDATRLSPYQRHLADRIATEGLNATLLPRFEPGLRSLLTHPTLAAVVVPSRVEPFGRIPLEAFVAGATPVVAASAGGLAELVTTDTGYIAEPCNPESLATALRDALRSTPADRVRLRAAGRSLAASRYNYAKTVHKFLTDIAPWTIPEPTAGTDRTAMPAPSSR